MVPRAAASLETVFSAVMIHIEPRLQTKIGDPWLAVTLLIRADELRTGQYVTPHCSLDLRFSRAF